MDTWRNVGHSFNLKIKLEQKGQGGKRSHFFFVLTVGEKKRGGREHQASLFDLRSFVGRISSGQGQKFIEGYAWIPKRKDFDEDPKE